MDTIFAQSSKPGKAGVAVFRISGPKSLFALNTLLEHKHFKPKPRFMHYIKLVDPVSKELIDHALVVYFKAPNSFTGEDIVEIYTHGSVAIATMLTRVLLSIEGVRLAEAGEFARRAFLNNKFDLTSAEGLADLIEAETIWQHRQAVAQAGGILKELYNSWRQKLLNIISLLEAYIDFPDEEIPSMVLSTVVADINHLKSSITAHLSDNRRGELLRNGIKLAILGSTNVGKSSLLNFLMQRDVAIVSNIAGTTRDVVEAHLDIGGYPIILQDTAGIRLDSTDIIEQEGMNRAIASAKAADIKIIMFDATKLTDQELSSPSIKMLLELVDSSTIIVVNKIDLCSELQPSLRASASKRGNPETSFEMLTKTGLPRRLRLLAMTVISEYDPIHISIKENIGLNKLLEQIEKIAHNVAGITEQPHITRMRYRANLEQALQHLTRFNLENDLVLATEDIRLAIRSLCIITGKISVEDILGEIFSNFCIGK